jgi:hypothetical protein
MPRGGYQQPANPAPVSGPGAMSKRTDGGPAQKLRDLPNAQYGESAVYRDLQQSAPLAQTPSPSALHTALGGGAAAPMPDINFTGPTARPDVPLTTPLAQTDTSQADLEYLSQYLPALEAMASLPTTSTETRNLIRYLRGVSQ